MMSTLSLRDNILILISNILAWEHIARVQVIVFRNYLTWVIVVYNVFGQQGLIQLLLLD